TARLWGRDGTPGVQLKHQRSVVSAMFSPNGQQVLTAAEFSYAQLWDRDGTPSTVFDMTQASTSRASSAVFSPDGLHVLVSYWDNTPLLYDLTGRQQQEFKHNYASTSAIFDSVGRKMVTIGNDHVVRVWDLAGSTLAAIKPLDQVQSAV